MISAIHELRRNNSSLHENAVKVRNRVRLLRRERERSEKLRRMKREIERDPAKRETLLAKNMWKEREEDRVQLLKQRHSLRKSKHQLMKSKTESKIMETRKKFVNEVKSERKAIREFLIKERRQKEREAMKKCQRVKSERERSRIAFEKAKAEKKHSVSVQLHEKLINELEEEKRKSKLVRKLTKLEAAQINKLEGVLN